MRAPGTDLLLRGNNLSAVELDVLERLSHRWFGGAMGEGVEVLRNWRAERPTSRTVDVTGSRYTTWMRALLLLPLVLIIACGDDSSPSDAGETDSTVDAGFDGGPPEDCETPGAVEDVACGRCGTIERFCSADGVWVFMGECSGEGVCDPGTTEDIACGMCGMQTSRCTDACQWEAAGACMSETGECTPGETQTTSDGCTGADVRELTCNATCEFEETLECGPPPGVDVMFLLHSRNWTGSGLFPPYNLRSSDMGPQVMLENFYAPTTALDGDVAVGVAGYTDFPIDPYGAAGDAPAFLLQEPTTSALTAAMATIDLFGRSGGDFAASGVEALQALIGPAHSSVSPSSCSAGREGWACWRPRSQRIIVMFADVPQHGAPGPGPGGVVDPYTGVSSPAEWSDVASSLTEDDISLVLVVDLRNQDDVERDVVMQHERMLTDLGLSADDLIVVPDLDGSITAFAAAVGKIEELL